MFRDNSLMPKEAVRLSALGLLSQGPRSYGSLANEVRHFTTRFWGPTLDVMGSSIELMRLEGLIADDADGMLGLTEAGRRELAELLSAAVRAEASDFSKLAIALKLRFMHVLPIEEQREQVDALVEMRMAEAARLTDLRGCHADDDSHFLGWLDREISRAEDDIAWLEGLRADLD